MEIFKRNPSWTEESEGDLWDFSTQSLKLASDLIKKKFLVLFIVQRSQKSYRKLMKIEFEMKAVEAEILKLNDAGFKTLRLNLLYIPWHVPERWLLVVVDRNRWKVISPRAEREASRQHPKRHTPSRTAVVSKPLAPCNGDSRLFLRRK